MLELCHWWSKETYGWQMLFTARIEQTPRNSMEGSQKEKILKSQQLPCSHHLRVGVWGSLLKFTFSWGLASMRNGIELRVTLTLSASISATPTPWLEVQSLERVSLPPVKLGAPWGHHPDESLLVPTSTPVHTSCVQQNTGHFRCLVNVCWTEKLFFVCLLLFLFVFYCCCSV